MENKVLSRAVYPPPPAMTERRSVAYSVRREVLDEGAVEEMAEKSEVKMTLSVKVKESLR